jgi:hypothetical protein
MSFSDAQIKVEPTGKIIVGNYPITGGSNDPFNILTMRIFGPNGNCAAGAKLSFADFGAFEYGGGNVVIGEYGNIDSDQMWLHGKNGFYLTRYNNTPQDVIAYYDPNSGNRFNFNCDVYSSGVKLASDERFKENIAGLESSLFRLKQLNGVSYNLKQISSVTQNETVQLIKSSQNVDISSQSQTIISGKLSEKELKSMALIEQWRKEQEDEAQKTKHLGFIAQDLQKIFPELVQEGKDGYMYVDYIGLIPVIVEAMKEQSNIIEAQSAKIKELEA